MQPEPPPSLNPHKPTFRLPYYEFLKYFPRIPSTYWVWEGEGNRQTLIHGPETKNTHHMCVCVYTYTQKEMCIYICIYTYIYIYVHTHTHMYIYIYIYTHKLESLSRKVRPLT